MNLLYFVFLIYLVAPSLGTSQQCSDVTGHANCRYIPDDSECGVRKAKWITNRIIGGKDATIGEFPWMACLHFEYNVKFGTYLECACGGSLITKWYVLTAAHCIVSKPGSKAMQWVTLGEHEIGKDPDCNWRGQCADKKQTIEIKELIVHSGYKDYPRAVADIGLVRLKTPAHLNRFVNIICLPFSGTYNHTDTMYLVMAGWGRVKDNTRYHPSVLQVLSPKAVSESVCQNLWSVVGLSRYITDNKICTSSVDGTVIRTAGRGDSGGPLMTRARTEGQYKYVVVGIISYSSSAVPETPAVHTRVTSYSTWILDHLQSNHDTSKDGLLK